jgi:hypothetical protein
MSRSTSSVVGARKCRRAVGLRRPVLAFLQGLLSIVVSDDIVFRGDRATVGTVVNIRMVAVVVVVSVNNIRDRCRLWLCRIRYDISRIDVVPNVVAARCWARAPGKIREYGPGSRRGSLS